MILQTGKKRKKSRENPKNEDDKCFHYAATVPLNREEINKDPQRILKVEPFINKYNWNGIKYLTKVDDWKTFEKNILAITLIILYIKQKEIYSACVSKHNPTREKQIILLIIPNEEKEGWQKKNYLHYYTE